MSQRTVLFLTFALGVLGTAYLTTLLLSTSPYMGSHGALWAFFSSLFITMAAWLSLSWYGIKHLFRRQRSIISIFPILRKSSLISMIIVLSLVLNSLGIFHLVDIIPLIVAAILIEFFFQAEKTPQATIELPHEVE